MKSLLTYLPYSIALFSVMFSTSTATTTSFSANYDDFSGALALTGTAPGTYEDIVYNSWIVVSRAGLAGGFAAQSTPNVILTSGVVQAKNGTPTFTIASPYSSANFKSFYIGCNLSSEESEVAVATQCTITVTAFQKSSNKEIAVASFTFTPPVDPVGQVPMVQAVLPSSFNKVYKIAVIQNSPTTQSLGIDNMVYTVSK